MLTHCRYFIHFSSRSSFMSFSQRPLYLRLFSLLPKRIKPTLFKELSTTVDKIVRKFFMIFTYQNNYLAIPDENNMNLCQETLKDLEHR